MDPELSGCGGESLQNACMSEPDVRWRQRLENFQQALSQLQAALTALNDKPGDEVIGMAVIKGYEFSFELSWKTLKDRLSYEGVDAATPRQVIREAFACGLLSEGQLWIDMLEQRNLMAHTYDAALARRAVSLIHDRYAPALAQLATALASDRDQLRRDQRRTPQG